MSIRAIKNHLVTRCGYRRDLIEEDYPSSRGRLVKLAAFAHRPFDARSACIAAIESRPDSVKQEVMAQRELGAPVILACLNGQTLQVWKPGQADAECIKKDLRGDEITMFFERHAEDLAPSRIYSAKTLGRLPGSGRQLEFVDSELLPFVESQIGDKLTATVEDVIDKLKASIEHPELTLSQERWIFKSTFVLLAAKILKDKRTPGFRSLALGDVEDVLNRVHKHYGSSEPVDLGGKKKKQALEESAAIIGQLNNLQNLTTEALADVYERALIDKSTRKRRGTHSTPPYLVDYILWQLAPWIEEMDPLSLRVFEPACGHAPFLVGMMRLLRSMASSEADTNLSEVLRKNLVGIESDPFALELARLSLTVADAPNPNGWQGLHEADMFSRELIESQARACQVLLTNPPFEGKKPLTLLQRALTALPAGAVFGAIVPTTLLFSTKTSNHTDLREFLIQNYQLSEVSLFPDKIFKFADHECSLLLGRRLRARQLPRGLVQCRRVREGDVERFHKQYSFTTDRSFLQRRLLEQPDWVPWVPELDDEVWTYLREFPTIDAIADVGQGMFYKGKITLKGRRTISKNKLDGFHSGYDTSSGGWFIHERPETRYFNLNPALIDRRVLGLKLGKPKVVLNYAAASREAWRLKPFIDNEGNPISSRLMAVIPKNDATPVEYLWALCCSPVAHAYLYTHGLKRDVFVGLVRKIPVPHHDEVIVRRISEAARTYLAAASEFTAALVAEEMPLFVERRVAPPTIENLHTLLRKMDAEVLRAFDLPSRSERKLLELFVKKSRPGVPGLFAQYYPDGFQACVPLYALLSESYTRFLHGESPELPPRLQARYEALLEKQAETLLSQRDSEELYRLQAEVDGKDYAIRQPNDDWLSELWANQSHSAMRIGAIANEIERLNARRVTHED